MVSQDGGLLPNDHRAFRSQRRLVHRRRLVSIRGRSSRRSSRDAGRIMPSAQRISTLAPPVFRQLAPNLRAGKPDGATTTTQAGAANRSTTTTCFSTSAGRRLSTRRPKAVEKCRGEHGAEAGWPGAATAATGHSRPAQDSSARGIAAQPVSRRRGGAPTRPPLRARARRCRCRATAGCASGR